jgi:hypothetical protein
MAAERHALVTGPIVGRIPTPDPVVPHDFVDVTPDVIYFDNKDHALAVAHAIEDEHWTRGSHPLQLSDEDYDLLNDEQKQAHVAAHREAKQRIEDRVAKHAAHQAGGN